MNPWHALALFGVGCVTDYFWTRWTQAVVDRRRLRAASWAFLICMPTVLTVTAYVRSPFYVMPYGFGCAIGTLMTVGRRSE